MRWKHPIRAVAIAIGAGLTGALALVPVPAAGHVATHQHTAIPAYWGPDTASGMEKFQRLAQNYPTNDIVIINGSQSMPQIPFNTAWANAIKKVHDAGALAIAYVDTGYYGFTFPPATPHYTRPDGPGAGSNSVAAWTAQIKKDVDDWHTIYGSYGVDGIFLDQTVALCGTAADPDLYVDLYAEISDYISDNYPDDYIIINPGVPVDQCYEDIADTIVTFENTYSVYLDTSNPLSQVPAWQQNSTNPNKFWHLIYDVPTAAAMQSVISTSKARNAGYVYVTDDKLTFDTGGNITDFPWDTIPAYWDNELLKASGLTDTSAPLAPSGLAGVATSGTSSAKVNLTWNISADNVAVAYYQVFQNGVSIGTSYNNGRTVTGLSPATTYQFKAKARDVAGNLSGFGSTLTITTPPAAAAPILSPSACLSPAIARFQATYVDPFTHRRVFLNSDNNVATGYPLPPGQPAGIDHMIENNFLYRYTGPGWAWEPVSGVAPLISSENDVFLWQVPTSALTGAASVMTLVFQAAPPDAYSSTLTVSQTPSC